MQVDRLAAQHERLRRERSGRDVLAVDNHPTRALFDRHVATLEDATIFSGGNDGTDGNVQLARRRDRWSVDGHPLMVS